MKQTFLFALLLLFSCEPAENVKKTVVEGYKPVYLSFDQVQKVESQPIRNIHNAGKIYIKDKYLFVMEQGEGIHIIDNSDKKNPKFVSFISVPLSQDISVKNNVLYTDNATNLVALDIADPLNIKVLKTIKDVFPLKNYPDEIGPFECVDNTKGFISRWEKAKLINPKCFR